MAKRKTTDAQEKVIRKRVLMDKENPKTVAADYNVSMTRIRNICGGALSIGAGVEKYWS